jgi:hypothetical protein
MKNNILLLLALLLLASCQKVATPVGTFCSILYPKALILLFF